MQWGIAISNLPHNGRNLIFEAELLKAVFGTRVTEQIRCNDIEVAFEPIHQCPPLATMAHARVQANNRSPRFFVVSKHVLLLIRNSLICSLGTSVDVKCRGVVTG